MKVTHRILIIVAMVAAIALGVVSTRFLAGDATWPIAQAQNLPKPFMVFDGTLYSGKPDLSAYGIQSVSVIYTSQFGKDWYKNADRMPDKETAQRLAQEAQAKNLPVVLDIEHWPLQGDLNQVRKSLSRYVTVAQWFKEAAPQIDVGYYGAPPIRDYWKSLSSPGSAEWASFARANDQLNPLVDAVDILFPSAYTFYTDRGGWVRYAYAQIAEARRLSKGKPVYVFIMPQYHDSNPSLKGAYLPSDFWRLQLQMAKAYADGVVIWGGWAGNGPARWDNNAAWWAVTKDFMKKVTPPRS